MSDLTEKFQGLLGKRMNPRDSLLLMGTIRLADEPTRTPEPIRIRNLSPTGLMGSSDASYQLGSMVEVDLRGIGLVGGEVIWSRDGRIGVTFSQAIDPKRARMPEAAGAKDRLWRVVTLGRSRRPGLRID